MRLLLMTCSVTFELYGPGEFQQVNFTKRSLESTACRHLHLRLIQRAKSFVSDLPTSAICATHGIRLQCTSSPRSVFILPHEPPISLAQSGSIRKILRFCTRNRCGCGAWFAGLQRWQSLQEHGREPKSDGVKAGVSHRLSCTGKPLSSVSRQRLLGWRIHISASEIGK